MMTKHYLADRLLYLPHIVLIASVATLAVFRNAEVDAGPPGTPKAIELGPGNEDIETRLENYVLPPKDANAEEMARTRLDLSGRDLRRMRLHLCLDVLHNISFDGADLTEASVQESGFFNCSFRGAKLRRIYAGTAIGPSCDLTDADISGSYIVLSREQLQSTRNFQEKNLSFTSVRGDFRGVSFATFDLRGAMFSLCDLTGCDFSNADIRGCTIQARYRRDSEFPEWPLVPFSEKQLYSTKSYRERNLAEVAFIGCDFRGADFSAHSLGLFQECDLRDASFSNASFFGSRKGYGVFPYAGERKCGFYNCELTEEQFYAIRIYKSRRLPENFVLKEMDLSGWDLSGFDLRGVAFH